VGGAMSSSTDTTGRGAGGSSTFVSGPGSASVAGAVDAGGKDSGGAGACTAAFSV
jgi:hypothetical protein